MDVNALLDGEADERRKWLASQRPARLRAHGVLDAPSAHGELIVASVGPQGEAISLWSRADDVAWLRGGTRADGTEYPDTKPDGPREVVVVQDGMEAARLELEVSFPFVQPLPDGEILVVGARCWHRADTGADHNALRFSADGQLISTATFGDGIEHLLTTNAGSAWVGYFDEGIFGNYGWAAPYGPEPIGSPGINRFGRDLSLEWSFSASASLGMADCYALNVDGETAWSCYYTDFPVTRIDNDVRTWTNSTAGARAIIVDDGWIALVGGYQGEHDRVVVGSLLEHEVEATEVRRLTLPDGSPLPTHPTLVARGAELDVFDGPRRYRIGVSDLRAPD